MYPYEDGVDPTASDIHAAEKLLTLHQMVIFTSLMSVRYHRRCTSPISWVEVVEVTHRSTLDLRPLLGHCCSVNHIAGCTCSDCSRLGEECLYWRYISAWCISWNCSPCLWMRWQRMWLNGLRNENRAGNLIYIDVNCLVRFISSSIYF